MRWRCVRQTVAHRDEELATFSPNTPCLDVAEDHTRDQKHQPDTSSNKAKPGLGSWEAETFSPGPGPSAHGGRVDVQRWARLCSLFLRDLVADHKVAGDLTASG